MDWIQKRLSGTFPRLGDDKAKTPVDSPNKPPERPPSDSKSNKRSSAESNSSTDSINAPLPSLVEILEAPQTKSSELVMAAPNRLSPRSVPHQHRRSVSASNTNTHPKSEKEEEDGIAKNDEHRKALEDFQEKLLENQREYERRLLVLTSALEEKAEQNVALYSENDKLKLQVADAEGKMKDLANQNQIIQRKFDSEVSLTKEFMDKITSLTNMVDGLTRENIRLKTENERLRVSGHQPNGNFPNPISNKPSTTKDIDRLDSEIIDADDLLPSSLEMAISGLKGAQGRHTSPRVSVSSLPTKSTRPYPSPRLISSSPTSRDSGGFGDFRMTELEKEIKALRSELALSLSKEEGLNESLDIYERELKRVKMEARTNLQLEGRRREDLEIYVKRLEQKVEELEFLIEESTSTTFDASEMDEESFEEEFNSSNGGFSDDEDSKDNVTIQPPAEETAGAAKPQPRKVSMGSPSGSPKVLSPRGAEKKSLREPVAPSNMITKSNPSTKYSRQMTGSPHRRGRSFDSGDNTQSIKVLKSPSNGGDASKSLHVRHNSGDFPIPVKLNLDSLESSSPLSASTKAIESAVPISTPAKENPSDTLQTSKTNSQNDLNA